VLCRSANVLRRPGVTVDASVGDGSGCTGVEESDRISVTFVQNPRTATGVVVSECHDNLALGPMAYHGAYA
jgi:hypothetical protein